MTLMNQYISRPIKKTIKHLFYNQKKNDVILKNCSVCNSNVIINPFPYQAYFEKWFENGFVYSPFEFETLNLKHYKCNKCGANDRDRLMALFLDQYLKNNPDKTISLIDFAPTKALPIYLKKLNNVSYRSADLYRKHVDDVVDITNMTIYKDESFDIFICSHILEHIENDLDAMSELYRITKSNGIGLCLVPIMLSLDKSVENKEFLKSEALRWKHFGQDDHVRMYSKQDFVSRLESVGFKVEQYNKDFFGLDLFEKFGIDHKSNLYVVKKN